MNGLGPRVARSSRSRSQALWRHDHPRPAAVRKWVADELSRIEATYGQSLRVNAVHNGDALHTVDDPAGQGWTGTARLIEVRPDAEAVEFTVFLAASPPSRHRPTVHLFGLDIRDDGRRTRVSMDSAWKEIRSGDTPALQRGIDRLVRGEFRPSLVHIRTRRSVVPYGA